MAIAMKRLLIACVLGAVIFGCSPAGTGPSEADAAETVDYAGAFVKGQEARAWMSSGSNHMFEASDETCKKVIEELYGLGAVEVRVTDASKVSEESPGEIAATLMAKLPADPAKRQALFDYEKEAMADTDSDTKRDYVEIVFD